MKSRSASSFCGIPLGGPAAAERAVDAVLDAVADEHEGPVRLGEGDDAPAEQERQHGDPRGRRR